MTLLSANAVGVQVYKASIAHQLDRHLLMISSAGHLEWEPTSLTLRYDGLQTQHRTTAGLIRIPQDDETSPVVVIYQIPRDKETHFAIHSGQPNHEYFVMKPPRKLLDNLAPLSDPYDTQFAKLKYFDHTVLPRIQELAGL